MPYLDDAKRYLDQSEGDVRDWDHKHDLQMKASVCAHIAIAEQLQALVQKLNDLSLVQTIDDLAK